ncbi:hypothetical protein [Dokdonella sp.]|uniref:hypothetical protein n=1 Tax=Dokdonella sp. TaxID=2291710 RepID=UPI0025C2A6AC|nr:hypothetical protein [Dokdonella sp.]MBX3688682.1 hypothetical protein [Dokdonella sp.]
MKPSTFLILAASLAGLSACTHTRSPTNEQLHTLLQEVRPRSSTVAPISVPTVQCLRAWSGDAELVLGVPASLAAESEGRNTCRKHLEGWLADSARNPAKFSFDDLVAPAVVRRVMAMVEGHDPAAARAAAQAAQAPMPPRAVLNNSPRTTAQVTGPMTDIGTTHALLKDADEICKTAKAKATTANAPVALQRFANYCEGYVTRAQGTLANAASLSPQQIEMVARGAKGIINGGQRALQEAQAN